MITTTAKGPGKTLRVVAISDAEVVDVFEHEGFTCVIRKVNLTGTSAFHCGYVKVADSSQDVQVEISSGISDVDTTYTRFLSEISADELTFSGELADDDAPDGYFLGFDSGHYWNNQRPHTKTFESVKERTKEMAEEIKERNIPERVLNSRKEAGDTQ